MTNKLGPYELNTIVTGDARILSEAIPDESVDLIFTDPPYPHRFLWVWEWLAKSANRILTTTGLCVAMSGRIHLPFVFAAFEKHLIYHWTYLLRTEGRKTTIWTRKLSTAWKPIIAYSKGEYDGPWLGTDVFQSTMADKRFHRWGQSVSSNAAFLARLGGAIVFDPFCGGGTVPAVCKMLGRKYLAFEIEPETAELARERVRNTQPPLFVPPQPKQIPMPTLAVKEKS